MSPQSSIAGSFGEHPFFPRWQAQWIPTIFVPTQSALHSVFIHHPILAPSSTLLLHPVTSATNFALTYISVCYAHLFDSIRATSQWTRRTYPSFPSPFTSSPVWIFTPPPSCNPCIIPSLLVHLRRLKGDFAQTYASRSTLARLQAVTLHAFQLKQVNSGLCLERELALTRHAVNAHAFLITITVCITHRVLSLLYPVDPCDSAAIPYLVIVVFSTIVSSLPSYLASNWTRSTWALSCFYPELFCVEASEGGDDKLCLYFRIMDSPPDNLWPL